MNARRNEQGFTLHEVLVAIIVGSLLISLCLVIVSFTGKQIARWKQRTQVEQSVQSTLQRVALDIQRSREILESTDSSLTLDMGIGLVVQYRSNEDGIWRNDVALAGSDEGATICRMRISHKPFTRECGVNVKGESGSFTFERSIRVEYLPSSKFSMLTGK